MDNKKQEITIKEFATKVSNCFFLELENEDLNEELRCSMLYEIPLKLKEKDFGFGEEEFLEISKFFNSVKIKQINLFCEWDICLAVYINTVYDEMMGILPTLLMDFIYEPQIREAIYTCKDYKFVSDFFTRHKSWKKPINDWHILLNELGEESRVGGEADF